MPKQESRAGVIYEPPTIGTFVRTKCIPNQRSGLIYRIRPPIASSLVQRKSDEPFGSASRLGVHSAIIRFTGRHHSSDSPSWSGDPQTVPDCFCPVLRWFRRRRDLVSDVSRESPPPKVEADHAPIEQRHKRATLSDGDDDVSPSIQAGDSIPEDQGQKELADGNRKSPDSANESGKYLPTKLSRSMSPRKTKRHMARGQYNLARSCGRSDFCKPHYCHN